VSLDMNLAFQIATAIVGFLGGWFLKVMFQRIDRLETADMSMTQAINDLRVELPSRYVSKQDFQQMGNSIFEALRRIEDKLDHKADKP